MKFLMTDKTVRACTLKTSYRETIRRPISREMGGRYQDIREKKGSERIKECMETCKKAIVTLYNGKRSSEEERRVDALALRAEERRDKLRKATGRSKYPKNRGCLNGETRLEELQSPCTESIGVRREPGELKHLSSRRKRKKHRFRE